MTRFLRFLRDRIELASVRRSIVTADGQVYRIDWDGDGSDYAPAGEP